MSPKLIRPFSVIAKILTTLAVVGLGVIAAIVVIGPSLGYQYAVVKSGSMVPAFPIGTVVMTQDVSAESVKVGDVISWRLPGEDERRISHRVVEIVREKNQLAFRTKGDANEEADVRLVPASTLTGKVIFSLPQVGKFTPLLQQTGLAFGLVFVCGAMLIAMEVEKIYRELRGKGQLATDSAMFDGVIRDFEPGGR